MRGYLRCGPQPSPHFSYSEINALPLNGQQAVTAISALWLRRSTAFRWLQQPIGRHLMIDVVEQVIERHQEVKNEGISERGDQWLRSATSLAAIPEAQSESYQRNHQDRNRRRFRNW